MTYPYQSLGKSLRAVREKRRESLAEVSGAVEIDIDRLTSIESGAEKPSEDILLLLISHFGIKEEEATKLWKLADYSHKGINENDIVKSNVLVMPGEARVIYTDVVHAVANQYGIVINFMQEGGPSGQPLIISRVGMSKDHARCLIDVLRQTLEHTEQKTLPPPKKIKKSDEKNS